MARKQRTFLEQELLHIKNAQRGISIDKMMISPEKKEILEKIGLIALDLDKTLLTSAGLTENSKECLEEAIRRGYQVVVATARPFSASARERKAPKTALPLPVIWAANAPALFSEETASEISGHRTAETDSNTLLIEQARSEAFPDSRAYSTFAVSGRRRESEA